MDQTFRPVPDPLPAAFLMPLVISSIGEIRHVFDVYMSPGSVTERVSFYAAPYGPSTRTHDGGGLDEEGETSSRPNCRSGGRWR